MNWAYTLGQIFIMFDLPTVKKHEVRAANKFRKNLLDLGFFMMQDGISEKQYAMFNKDSAK